MQLIRKEAIRLHRQLWALIAIETRKRKRKIRKIDILIDHMPEYCFIDSECFCCEYCFENDYDCSHCPISWGTKNRAGVDKCNGNASPYMKWSLEVNWHKAAEYAEEIALLPERVLDGED